MQGIRGKRGARGEGRAGGVGLVSKILGRVYIPCRPHVLVIL